MFKRKTEHNIDFKEEIKVNEIGGQTKKNMSTRVISAVVLLIVCFPCAILGGWYFFVLISAVALFAINEVIKSTNKGKKPVLLYVFIYVCAISLIYWGLIKNNLVYFNVNGKLTNDILATGFSKLQLSTIAVAMTLGGMFLVTISNDKFTIEDVVYYFSMTVLLALGFQSIFYVRYIPFTDTFANLEYFDTPLYKYAVSNFLLIFVLIGSMVNDIGAYFIGVLFGKRKMNERISPKKTWEGFFGGIFISALCSLIFAFAADACGYPMLSGYLDIEHWYWILLLSLLMPLITNLGDLAFSAIKRYYKIKDFGNIIPGHGGVLDRIDSLLFNCIAVTCILTFILNGWNFAL